MTDYVYIYMYILCTYIYVCIYIYILFGKPLEKRLLGRPTYRGEKRIMVDVK
jgi:hypothetical protein